METADGVLVRGSKTYECEPCALGKMKRQIWRFPKEIFDPSGCRWAIDFRYFNMDSEGYVRAMLFTDRPSGYIFITFTKRKHGPALAEGLANSIGMLKNRFNLIPVMI